MTRLRVAAGLLWRRGRVLLLRRSPRAKVFPRKWEFPGGKLRPGEDPRAGLARELAEELGIRARPGRLVAHYSHRYSRRLRVELWFFHVRRWRGRVGRSHRVQWVPVASLPKFDLLEGDAPLVARLTKVGGSHARPRR